MRQVGAIGSAIFAGVLFSTVCGGADRDPSGLGAQPTTLVSGADTLSGASLEMLQLQANFGFMLRGNGTFYARQTEQPHPTTGVVSVMVTDLQSLSPDDTYRFCVIYGRALQTRARKGRVVAIVEHLTADGAPERVTKFKGRVGRAGSRSDRIFEDCRFVSRRLGIGDILIFRFKFRKMPTLPIGAWAQYLGWAQH